jgi:N utilization substance protein A
VSSVTLGDPDEDGGQRSVLVIVPDSQLSLAIGKRGQNARLAAKLTGLRVDIKSESEVEEERRREEEELHQGRAALAQFPGVGPQLVEKLVEKGLYSPARILEAGVEGLQQIPGVGEKKAVSLVEAAQAWMVEQAAAAPPAEVTAEDPGAEQALGDSVGSSAQPAPAE